ncbi:PucR family transcriptional regulator ligand-binding domain-containing protein [Tsukamurella sp. PLM1]|uniref:PucR family transcriptional regulator ligand-binding domain-containing protein n=1 Tax=Tsukamurella sp. PLM1 TaxID=2929795 RepID=UPI00206947CF|nr:PucR family transcriptional regulator ligand-binding domain-containing protein [Tsukamurella sp. PLM1]BDH55815.1 hypothetical protein MTP03_07540 [Tsukamurella sp. PLM1]
MTVSVRWLLAQRDLGLRLRAGDAGAEAEISFVMTTELTDPTPWLAGGELVLTTGIGIPPDAAGCRAYVRRLRDRGISALGFGVGVSRDSAPSALVTEADELGLALVDVPLPTPFVAVARAVIDEIARRANAANVEAGRAQQRMTRAAVAGGPSGTLRELAIGCGVRRCCSIAAAEWCRRIPRTSTRRTPGRPRRKCASTARRRRSGARRCRRTGRGVGPRRS